MRSDRQFGTVAMGIRDGAGREVGLAEVDVAARGALVRDPWGKGRPGLGEFAFEIEEADAGEVTLCFGGNEARFASADKIPDRALLAREREALAEQAIDAFLDDRGSATFRHPRSAGDDFLHPALGGGRHILQPGGILERSEPGGRRQFRSVGGALCERLVPADPETLSGEADGLPPEWEPSGVRALADPVVCSFAKHCGCRMGGRPDRLAEAAAFAFAIEEFEAIAHGPAPAVAARGIGGR